jgi:hypothetical protein
VVASPTVYGQSITDRANGLIASTADEWEHALSLLVESEPFRRRLREDLRRDVMSRWALRKNVWRWPAAWSRLVDGEGGA